MSNLPNKPDLETLLAHGKWVQSLARSLVADGATAEDIEQQAWLTALERPPKHEGNLRSWWTSVVRSVAGKGRREEANRRTRESRVARAEGAKDQATPDELAERMDTFKRLSAAVINLPEPYGSAIYLRYFEELKVREVAERQGVSADTAQTHINRGLEKLRAAMREDLGGHWRQLCAVLVIPVPGITAAATAGVSATTATGLSAATGKSLLTSASTWVLVVAAGLTLMFWPSDEEATDPEGTQVVEAETSTTTIPSSSTANSTPIDDAKAQSGSTAKAGRTEAATLNGVEPGFQPWGSDGPMITVIGQDGKPISGAEVVCMQLSGAKFPESMLHEAAQAGADHVFTLYGDRYRANGLGKVRIAKPDGKVFLVGRTGEMFGTLSPPSAAVDSSDEITLRVERTPLIPVSVHDETGEPLENAEVALGLIDTDFHGGMTGSKTNGDGMAWVRFMPGMTFTYPNHDFAIHLNVGTATPIIADFDENNPPTDPVALVAPSTGRVVVTVSGDAAASSKKIVVGLGALRKQADGTYEERSSGPSNARTAVNGRAEFPHVALGQKIQCVAVSLDFEFNATETVDGPKTAGETVNVEILPIVEGSSISGRILNEEGMVAKNIRFKVDTHYRSPDRDFIRRDSFRTDAEGRFQLLQDGQISADTKRTLSVIMRKTSRKPERVATFDLSRDLPPGTTDVGDLVVRPAPTLVEGRVLSYLGEPVSGARVIVEFQSQRNFQLRDNTVPESEYGEGMFFSASSSDGPRWQTRDDWKTISNENGKFSFTGVGIFDHYRLSVSHFEYVDAEVEILPGDTGLDVVLGKPLTVSGTVLLDPGLHRHGLQPALLTPKKDKPGEYFSWGELLRHGGGVFKFPGVDPGTHAASIRTQWLREEIHFFPEFQINEQTGDVELPPVDLRGKLRSIRVSVVNPNGDAIPKARIGTLDDEWLRPFEFQPLVLTTTKPSFDFQIAANGYRTVRINGATDHQRIVLKKGIPARFTVSNMDSIPVDWDLKMVLIPVLNDDAPQMDRSWSTEISAAGSAKKTFPEPATYKVGWRILHQRNNHSIRKWIDLPASSNPQRIVIEDRTEIQEFELNIDSSALAAALERGRLEELEWDRRQGQR